MNVTQAVETRRSVRAFADRAVDLETIDRILRLAARAPSGGNLQPWHIHVVAGTRMAALKALMARRVVEAPQGEEPEYAIYPPALDSPFRDRRFAVAEAMYAELGISRQDKAARVGWFARNYQFFGASVALFCYVDRRHGPPQWSDCGMYLQTVMLLLREAGLDSCAQECWAMYHDTIDAFLGAPGSQMLFTGMAIGWKDEAAPINRFRAARAPAEDYIRYHQE